MEQIKNWFLKIKEFFLNLIKEFIVMKNEITQSNNQVKIEAIKAGKEIIFAVGRTVCNGIKVMYNDKATYLVIVGLGVGLGAFGVYKFKTL